MIDKEYTFPAGAEVSIIPVMQGDGLQKIDESTLPDILPVLALRNAVLFPGTIFPVTIGREKSIKLIRDAEERDMFIACVPQTDVTVEDPSDSDLFTYGTVAKILKSLEMPDGTLTAILQGFKRLSLDSIIDHEPYLTGRVHYLDDYLPDGDRTSLKAIADSLKEQAGHIIRNSSMASREAISAIRNIDNFQFLVNFIATTVEVDDFSDKMDLLQYDDVKVRAMKLLSMLNMQLELTKIKQDINQKVKSEIDQQQREFYLNSQLRTIQEELGMDDGDDVEALRARAEKKDWPKEIAEVFDKELNKLSRYNANSPDYSIQYNYLDFMLNLPWNETSVDNLDLKHAQKVLDDDHYGLDTVKDRIIEYLAVLKLKGNMKSPILCLYGPPGVGKTSLGKSIADALGRKYVRISLGGVHDEAEIRGHRKTYIGAMPGRIIKGLAKAGSSNPVFILDEIDKISQMTHNGDPSSALLEVLDPEQNNAFHDNFLDVDYDLSHVMFIATANNIQTIPAPLLDRMELIEMSGYLTEEKVEIARRHLVHKQMTENGIPPRRVSITKPALEKIVENYTRESGVRELDKKIGKIFRKMALEMASNGLPLHTSIGPKQIPELLGVEEYTRDRYQGNDYAGVVTGLAWTAVGGEILFIETSLSHGKGQLTLTGNLGDVMKESATIALEYLKAHAAMLDIDPRLFEQWNIHLHVPEGAIPKDGPSAGITMATALASAFTQRKVRDHLAMTGEITLRGKVLPVGGIKEKILAAKRAGITDIILSEENRRHISDIQPVYLAGLTFHYVNEVSEVWSLALLDEKVKNPLDLTVKEEKKIEK